jgi:hypothetical protein
MNLGVICNIKNNIPECVIVHDYETGDIGYSTYNNKLSKLLNIILDNKIYSENLLNNIINYNDCDKNNPFYISNLNNYLPYPYKILWIKKISGNINEILEEAYDILKLEDSNEEIE